MRSYSIRVRAALLTLVMLLAALSAQASPTPTPAPTLPPFDESVPAYDASAPEALTADQLYAVSCSDKKIAAGTIRLVVPEAIGGCTLRPMALPELRGWIEKGLQP